MGGGSPAREYGEEFARLLQLHARTPDRWKYFQTEWMWRYVGGMVDGRTAREVYDARIAELEADDAQDEARKEEELIVLRRSQFRVVRPGSHVRARRRSRDHSRRPSRPRHRLPTIVIAEREESNAVSSWQTRRCDQKAGGSSVTAPATHGRANGSCASSRFAKRRRV